MTNGKSNILLEELRTVLGDDCRILTSEGNGLQIEKDHAVIILQGNADLFVAKRMDGQPHGRPLPLCSLTPGCLIPPIQTLDDALVYGRCLAATQFALVPWNRISQSQFFREGTTQFAKCAAWEEVPETPEDFQQKFEKMCQKLSEDFDKDEVETRWRIYENAYSHALQEDNIFRNLASLFNPRESQRVAPRHDDPAAAAAERTAAISGLPDFSLAEWDKVVMVDEDDAGHSLNPPRARREVVMQRLEESVHSQRLRITPAQLERGWYKQSFFPTMLLAKDGTDAYCAYRNHRNDAVAWSGATGKTYVLDREFCETIEPMGWNFVNPFPKGKITPFMLLRFASGFCRRLLPTIIILTLLGMLLELLTPVVNSLIFSDVIPNSNCTLLGMLSFLLLVTALAKTFLGIISYIFIWLLQDCASIPLSLALFDHVMRLPANYFRNEATGKIAQMINGCISFFSELPVDCLISGIKILFSFLPLGMIFYYSTELSLTLLPIYLVTILVLLVSSYFIRKYSLEDMQKQGELSGILECFISGIAKLRTAGAENHAIMIWSRKMVEEKTIYKKFDVWNITLNFMFTLLPWVIFCASTAYIVWNHMNGRISDRLTLADYSGFISAAAILNAMLVGFLMNVNTLFRCASLFQWLRPLLDTEEEEEGWGTAEETDFHGDVALENVSFAYDPEHPILKNVSLHAKPGEFIAITGESGAGKSTILRLLLQFEHPTSGAVLYDNEDIENINMSRLRSRIGVVMQNANVLADTIQNNITGMSSRATAEEAWRAAEMAGCAEDIRNFPMQMQTMLSSSAVSGGQKQRILLAHALLRNPKIIFLDEATSALDNGTQRHVIEALQKISATKIVIAHRLSTIMDADRIYVLEKGSVVETGTYQELLRKGGVFAAMAKRQLVNEEEGTDL